MKNIFPDLMKIAYNNKIIKPSNGAISYKEANSRFFLINSDKILDLEFKPYFHRIYIEKDYFEINNDTKKVLPKDVNFHGLTMIKNFNSDLVLLQPCEDFKLIKDFKDHNFEIININSDKLIIKSDVLNVYNFIKSL
jgi:hypothetical protein